MNSRHEYVAEQLSLVFGQPVTPSTELTARWWPALTRRQERGISGDIHGNFQASAMEFPIEEPILHPDIAMLAHRLTMTARWPNNKRFAACLTHDVDRIVQLPWRERLRQSHILRKIVPLAQRTRWILASALYATASALGFSDQAVYDFWMQEEGRYHFHSTFFVLPEQLATPTTFDHYYRYADQVRYEGQAMTFTEATREVRASGWEIGLHGSYVSAYDTQILADEKAQVERMLQADIHSVRQHYLRFVIDLTPHVQARAGFRTDSTLGFSDAIGYRAGMAFPFFWSEEPELLEIPLIIQDVALAALAAGDDISQPATLARVRSMIKHIASVGGVISLSWHTHSQAPGAQACYRELLAYINDLGGWGCSVNELDAWWRLRRHTVIPKHFAEGAWQSEDQTRTSF